VVWEREKIDWQEPRKFDCLLVPGEGENDWQEARKFDCRLVRTIFIFLLSLVNFHDTGEWPENQILIPDWTYFHCPGATLRQSTVRVK